MKSYVSRSIIKFLIGLTFLMVLAACDKPPPTTPAVYDADGNPVTVNQPQDHSIMAGVLGFLAGQALSGNRSSPTPTPPSQTNTTNTTVIKKTVIVVPEKKEEKKKDPPKSATPPPKSVPAPVKPQRVTPPPVPRPAPSYRPPSSSGRR